MGFLDGLEKLINEHGSAAILRERIVFLNEQHAAVLKKVAALDTQVADLQREKEGLHIQNEQLKQQVGALKKSLTHDENPMGYACDHCGSTRLKRTGSRPDPTFAALGAKEALFVCEACGGQTAVSQNP